jgi:hypothetical protein
MLFYEVQKGIRLTHLQIFLLLTEIPLVNGLKIGNALGLSVSLITPSQAGLQKCLHKKKSKHSRLFLKYHNKLKLRYQK